MHARAATVERRRWRRLPLAIPVFVRGPDGKEKACLEFATALNVSAGGMLLAVRRAFPSSARVSLEIPSAPLAAVATLPKAARRLRGKILRLEHAEGYSLVALEFSQPLLRPHAGRETPRRKSASSV